MTEQLNTPRLPIDTTKNSILTEPLVDSFGREHTDMRFSITERCNFRCTYCMREDQRFNPSSLDLTPDEILKIASIAHGLGIRAVRITGGEPLMRKDVVSIVEKLKNVGFDELTMTTNASLLSHTSKGVTMAQNLKDAGLDRLNVSCDSLNSERFKKIRRRGTLQGVTNGLQAAYEAGFEKIKMNVVVIRGINDDEILDFAQFARMSSMLGRECIVRFIEHMPLGETGDEQTSWTPDKVVPAEKIVNLIDSKWPIEIANHQGDHAPASRWSFSDGFGEIGVIPTMTNRFCGDCNRLRVTSDGTVVNCLFSPKEAQFQLRDKMRTGCTDEEIAQVFHDAVNSKKAAQNRNLDEPTILESPGAYIEGGSRGAQGTTMSQIGG
jgi:cyclic pyranopterin phosphate synthase